MNWLEVSADPAAYAAQRRQIAPRVAERMGWTVEETIERMEALDRLAMVEFCVGNDIPAQERH